MQTEHDLMSFLSEDLGADSEDLSDEDVASAQPLITAQDITKHLKGCETCGAPFTKLHYKVRRRKPQIYWLMDAACANKHKQSFVFRPDFYQSPPS
jgi:hypothetical protein